MNLEELNRHRPEDAAAIITMRKLDIWASDNSTITLPSGLSLRGHELNVLMYEVNEQEEGYLFTFGSGHVMLVTSAAGVPAYAGKGIELQNKYIRVKGTWDDARRKFVTAFSNHFCDQYPDTPARREVLARYGITELRLTEMLSG